MEDHCRIVKNICTFKGKMCKVALTNYCTCSHISIVITNQNHWENKLNWSMTKDLRGYSRFAKRRQKKFLE